MLLSFKPLDFYPQRCNALTLITLLMPSLAAGLRLFGNVSFLKLGAILFQMILRSAFVTTGERLTPWKPSVVQNSFLLSEEFLL
jgi:F0F1-type ATP synthase membrane subunit a